MKDIQDILKAGRKKGKHFVAHNLFCYLTDPTDAVTRDFFVKKVFFKISQNSLKTTVLESLHKETVLFVLFI